MRARLLKFWDDVHSSYWFVPTLMSLGAILMSFAVVALDQHLGDDWIRELGWLRPDKPSGGRAILGTIAGSMITVAGVTFSITIAAVSYASGQFGPRILSNFMQDRGNQITLGTFLATFLYCLLVLRTIRSADESDAADAIGAFIPHLGILFGLFLALASLGVLIFFIHHIPESIHISNVIAHIGRELNRRIDTLFPERLGEEKAEDTARTEALPDDFEAQATAIRARGTGYIQRLDESYLVETLRQEGLCARLLCRPGDFIRESQPLLLVAPADELTEKHAMYLARAFAWGSHRTQVQDVRFLANELVEIAARALSPGVNDPFTAISCLDWLGSTLTALTERSFPNADRYDDDGHLRLVAEPVQFSDFCDLIFGQLRPYVKGDRNAALHTFKLLAEAGAVAQRRSDKDALRHHAEALLEGCEATMTQPTDRAEVRARYAAVRRILDSTLSEIEADQAYTWVGGSA